jgi:hypothetical protein
MVVTLIPFWSLVKDWIQNMILIRKENLQFGCLDFSSLPALFNCTLPERYFRNTLVTGIVITVLLLAIAFVWKSTLPGTRSFHWQISMVIITGLLVIDNIRVADLVIGIPVIIFILSELRYMTNQWKKRSVIGLVIMAYSIPYIADFLAVVTQNKMWTLAVWYSLVSICLFIALIILKWGRNFDGYFPSIK